VALIIHGRAIANDIAKFLDTATLDYPGASFIFVADVQLQSFASYKSDTNDYD
jgi:hypothetical protein